MEQRDRRPLRNIHHLWHPRALFLEDPLTTLFRNLKCSTVDIWSDIHWAIHGQPWIQGLWPGLYLPPVMPTTSVMRSFVDKHAGRVPCGHSRGLVTVNVFDFSQDPWSVSFREPCANVIMDIDMLDLLRAHLFRNPRAKIWEHQLFLTKRHERGKCTCHFAPDVRHVLRTNPRIAA